jgi:hypothetical protein
MNKMRISTSHYMGKRRDVNLIRKSLGSPRPPALSADSGYSISQLHHRTDANEIGRGWDARS